MKLSAVVRELIAAGLEGEALIAAIERIEASEPQISEEPTAHALRQRRYRERHAGVTKRHEASRGDASPPQSEELFPLLNQPDQSNPTPPPSSPPTPAQLALFELESEEVQPSFDEFWEAYPVKVGKGRARAKFDTAVELIGSNGPSVIMFGLATAKASRKWLDEPEYIPHPATWLHQQRWADEPDNRVRQLPMTAGMVAAASDEAAMRLAKEMMRDRAGREDRGNQGALAALPAPAAHPQGRGPLVN